MKFKSLATTTLSIFALLWNAIVHLVILKSDNKVITSLHRPDINDKIWLSVVLTIAIAFLFTINFLKWRKKGGIIETLKHSLFFSLLMMVAIDLNQYIQYAIPFSLIIKWSFFGLIEFAIYGLILEFLITKNSPLKR